MSDAAEGRRPAWPAAVFAVTMVGLLGWNVWLIARNQTIYAEHDRPGVSPRDISKNAQYNAWDQVWATYRFYYSLRRLGAGTTLVVPSEMEGHRFYVEELSRLELEVTEAPSFVEDPLMEHIQPTERTMLDGQRPCLIVLEPGATRYITVRTKDFRTYAILTPARYERELAWYKAEAPRHPDWFPDPERWYVLMRELGTGSTLVIPTEMAGHRPSLERIAGLHIESAPKPPVVPRAFIDSVKADHVVYLDRLRSCAIALDPGATRYVIVHTDDFRAYLVLSETRYLERSTQSGTNLMPK
jgi:hypothetical protein